MTEPLNQNLQRARRDKNDEFFTQTTDILNEIQYYRETLKGKVVFCNCNDGLNSGFVQYFMQGYDICKLKGFHAIEYEENGNGTLYSFTGDVNHECNMIMPEDFKATQLQGDGGYRTKESLAILDKADVIITNPPFSLFRDYVSLLVEKGKKFLIIGNQNALTYKEIFTLLMENKVWTGYSTNKAVEFRVPDDYPLRSSTGRIDGDGVKYLKVPGINWYTNLPVRKREEPLELWRKYTPEEYPKYDNYDAINVNSVADIPVDYAGVMGVPITYLNVHCPAQFEILGCTDRGGDGRIDDLKLPSISHASPVIGSRQLYTRILIRHRNPQT